MVMNKAHAVVLVQLCLIVCLSHAGDKKLDESILLRKDKIEADITVDNTLLALEKITFYYSKNKKDATVDFAFGMRIAEGEISRMLSLADAGTYIEIVNHPGWHERLQRLHQSMQEAVKQSLPFIEQNNKKYFSQFYYLINEKWSSYQLQPQYSVQSDITVFPNTSVEDILEEEDSDLCMTTLFGDSTYKSCSLDVCWDKMTTRGKYSYFATHQILWLSIGAKFGCHDKMNRRAIESGYPGGIDEIIKKMCAGIIIEMEAITAEGFRKSYIDIFLEQGFVCGSIGFMDAVRPNWLKLAFRWQEPNVGCFIEQSINDFNDDMNEFSFWINLKREQWKSRNLLVDTLNSDGCSTHTTGVAVAFFATYLRLFFDPVYKRNQLDTYLHVPVIVVPPAGSPAVAVIIKLSIVGALVILFAFMVKKRLFVAMYSVVWRRLHGFYARMRSRSSII